MSVTPAGQLSAVTRTVTPVDGGHVVALSQVFPLAPAQIWEAVTDPESLRTWFGRAEGELREGGRYTLPDMETRGTVRTVEAPHRLVLSWEYGAGSSELELRIDPAEGDETSSAGAGSAEAGGSEAGSAGAGGAETATGKDEEGAPASRFTLAHTVPADAHWQTFGPAATGCGWDGALYGLALHLQDPSVSHLRRLGDFAVSERGAQFTRDTAEAWYEAHVAAGAHRKPARKASLRTAAFYQGEEPEL